MRRLKLLTPAVLIALLLCCGGITGVSAQQADPVKPDVDAQDQPDQPEDQDDPESGTDEPAPTDAAEPAAATPKPAPKLEWQVQSLDPDKAISSRRARLPHTKGEHFAAIRSFSTSTLYAALDATPAYDPLWNLRFGKAAADVYRVQANELTVMESVDDVEGVEPNWRRATHERWPDRHANPADGWDMPHSPHVAAGRLRWLQYRKEDLNGNGRFDWNSSDITQQEYFTHYVDVASGRVLAKLNNLADSPRPHPDMRYPYVVFRVFSGADAKCRLELWRLPLLNGEQAKRVAVYAPKDYAFLSRAQWVGPNTLALVAASSLAEGERFYQGELITLTLSGLTNPADNEVPLDRKADGDSAEEGANDQDSESESESESDAEEADQPAAPDTRPELERFPLPSVAFAQQALQSGLFPVETQLDPLLFNPTNGLLAVLSAPKALGEQREITQYRRFAPAWFGLLADMAEQGSSFVQSNILRMQPDLREALKLDPALPWEKRRQQALEIWRAQQEKWRKLSIPVEKNPAPITPSSTTLPEVAGLWRVDGGFQLIADGKVWQLDLHGQLLRPKDHAGVELAKLMPDLHGAKDVGAGDFSMPGMLALIGTGPAVGGAVGQGFAFKLVETQHQFGLFGEAPTIFGSDASVREALPNASWINQHNTSRKIAGKLTATDDNTPNGLLHNTVMTYNYQVLVEQEGVKNSSGAMLEIYQSAHTNTRQRRSYPAKIRTEDNLGGSWIVRSFNGERAYLSDDKIATLNPTPGDSLDKLKAQLEARRFLLMLNDPEAPGAGYASSIGYGVQRDPLSNELIKTISFVVRSESGHQARLTFNAESEHHDLVAVFLRFPLGQSTRQIMLWLSDYQDLPDLSGDNQPLRVPGSVRGYNPDDGSEVFTAELVDEVRRDTSETPIPSGYNWAPVKDAVFESAYALK